MPSWAGSWGPEEIPQRILKGIKYSKGLKLDVNPLLSE